MRVAAETTRRKNCCLFLLLLAADMPSDSATRLFVAANEKRMRNVNANELTKRKM